jgi:hypothetical protein
MKPNLNKVDLTKGDQLLRRTAAAKYVTDTFGFPCSPRTLAKLACVSSQGPPFRLAGRIPLYPVAGLDEWGRARSGRWFGQLLKSAARHLARSASDDRDHHRCVAVL